MMAKSHVENRLNAPKVQLMIAKGWRCEQLLLKVEILCIKERNNFITVILSYDKGDKCERPDVSRATLCKMMNQV